MQKKVPRDSTGILLFVVVLLAIILRCYRIGDPFDGFHAFNEGWYASTARNFQHAPLSAPTVAPGMIDYKIRPVYPYLAYFSMKIFGYNEAAARGVTVVFGIAAILFVYIITTMLANSSAGIGAALVFSFMPISVLLGRQAQPDMTSVALTLAAACLYLRARLNPGKGTPIAFAGAGILWGLAIFTKNTAVLLLPGILMAEPFLPRQNTANLKKTLLFIIPAVLIPLPFAFMLAKRSLHEVLFIYESFEFNLPSVKTWFYIFREAMWGMSPPVFFAGLAGLLLTPFGNNKKTAAALAMFIPFMVFYIMKNVHSYYLLGASPFFAIGAGLLIGRLKKDTFLLTIMLITLVTAIHSFVLLASLKWDNTRLQAMFNDFRLEDKKITIVADAAINDNLRSLFFYYLPDADIIRKQDIGQPTTPQVPCADSQNRVFMVDPYDSTAAVSEIATAYSNDVFAIDFMGRLFLYVPMNKHSFIPRDMSILPSDSTVLVPTVRRIFRTPSIMSTPMPEGYCLVLQKDGLVFVPSQAIKNDR